MGISVQSRRGTAAEWAAADPVLLDGEAGYDSTNNQVRYGDGVTVWSGLSPLAATAVESDPVFVASEAYGFSAGDVAKLGGIEASADVTDATNVASAGAFMASNVIDEDDMVSNLDTKVPTQQSVKAYVDAVPGATLSGLLASVMTENDSLKLDPALSADGKYNGITETGLAGATLSFGNVIYQAVGDDRWELAKADATATSVMKLGICVLAAAADGDPVTVLLIGKVRADAIFPTFTKYAPVFISEATAGLLTNTAPSTATNIIRCVGQAISADELWFNPDNAWAEV